MAGKSLRFGLLAALVLLPAAAELRAKEESSASFVLSGVVPALVSASIDMNPGALVFNPGERVRGRVIGRLHLKYNTNLGAVLFAANTPGGIPANASGPYPFGPQGFSVSIGPCPGIAPALSSPIRFPQAAGARVDIGSRRPITASVNASCELLASWDGAEQEVPEGSVYSLGFSLSLVPAD